MLNRLFASTAIAALIASGAYAQTTETEEGQVQAEQQDRIAPARGQEISVRDGDTVTLESGDVEFTVRVRSSETSAVPGDNLASETGAADDTATAETEDMASADTDNMSADDSAAATDSASDTGDQAAENTAEPTATDEMASDAGMAGQDGMVSNGDILIISSEGENFQLNFEVSEDGAMAAMDDTAMDSAADSTAIGSTASDTDTATTGSIATDGSAISSVDRDDLQARALDQIRADDLIGSTVYGSGDEQIGDVGDVILTQDGQVDALLVDVGGFLGIGSREVAIGLESIEFMVDDRENWYVYTPFTEEQLEAQTEYDASTFAEQRDQQLLIVR